MEFQQRDPADLDQAGVRIWTIIQDLDQTFWAEPLKTPGASRAVR